MLNYGVRRTEQRENIWHLWTEKFSTERLSTIMENSISKPLSPHLENRKAISSLVGLPEEILTSFWRKHQLINITVIKGWKACWVAERWD